MGLDGIDTRLSTFFPYLNVWTTLYWLNDWSSAKWACWEFLGFIIGWLCKVPFASHFVDWLIGSFEPLASVLFTWGNLGSSCTFSYFSHNHSFSFQVEDSGREMVELGWKNFANSLKNWADGWENYNGN